MIEDLTVYSKNFVPNEETEKEIKEMEEALEAERASIDVLDYDNEHYMFKFAELKKITLESGDVLSVKLIGDDFDRNTVDSLKRMLVSVFPKNKVIVFAMPAETDILFEVVKQPTESESK